MVTHNALHTLATKQIWLSCLNVNNEEFLQNKSFAIKKDAILLNNASLSVMQPFDDKTQVSADSVK